METDREFEKYSDYNSNKEVLQKSTVEIKSKYTSSWELLQPKKKKKQFVIDEQKLEKNGIDKSVIRQIRECNDSSYFKPKPVEWRMVEDSNYASVKSKHSRASSINS